MSDNLYIYSNWSKQSSCKETSVDEEVFCTVIYWVSGFSRWPLNDNTIKMIASYVMSPFIDSQNMGEVYTCLTVVRVKVDTGKY